uniref:Large ribosomal subunit protein mL49 n=1 Tax=Cacopsylla melanoneura TaxID=428564 RepID=A0A8D8W424_9HEMI
MQCLLRVNRIFSKPLLKELIPLRHGSYRNPKLVSEDLSKYTDYEVSKNPEEWKYVEQLIPSIVIPEPKYEPNLPSGYKPPSVKPGTYPYHVKRSRNHMLPVYLEVKKRTAQRKTSVNHISGDIWKLHDSLQKHLAKIYPNEPMFPSQVNEVFSRITFRGDYYNAICKFFYDRGF